MPTLARDHITFAYLLPTRDAVALERPAARPLVALGELAEQLDFDAVWVGDSPLARARHDALLMLSALADGWLPYPPTAELYREGWTRVRAAATAAGRDVPHAGLYATVALDTSPETARERLRRNIERYYGQPLEPIASIQAIYAGRPDGLAEWLAPYVQAGARHIVLRVTDEDAERGLRDAARARELALDALAAETARAPSPRIQHPTTASMTGA